MTALPEWLLPVLGGNTLVSAALGYFVPAMVTRKKDAGELANDMLTKALERIDKLELDSAKCHASNTALTLRCERNEFVSDLLIVEVHALAPNSPVIAQARYHLKRAFPINLDTPADMAAALNKIS